MMDPVSIAKRAFQAYVDSDRDALEAVIAEDFSFTSPLDNGLDRQTYFERCWPNNETMTGVEYIQVVADEDRAWVMYDGKTKEKTFRNTEVHTVRDGKIVEVLVFFGWDVPHPAPAKGSVKNGGQGS